MSMSVEDAHARPRAWLVNYATSHPGAAADVLDLVENDKLADAFWHIAGLDGGIPGEFSSASCTTPDFMSPRRMPHPV